MAHMSSDQNPASSRPDTPLINASRTIHRRNIKGERMRQAILNAATSLFAAHGYNYVRIADIAKQVGISDAEYYTISLVKRTCSSPSCDCAKQTTAQTSSRRIPCGK